MIREDKPSAFRRLEEIFCFNSNALNFDVSKLQLEIPQYYKGCLRTWLSLRPSLNFESNIVEEIIWNNKTNSSRKQNRL